MAGLLPSVDGLLRGRLSPVVTDRERRPVRIELLVLLVVLFGLIYGAAMGTYAGRTGVRPLQMLYSGTKVPLLLLATFLISLPSFFVANTLAGLRDDFADVLRALAATQAVLTVTLASLAPFTLLWYLSVEYYRLAILFNGLMFAVATFAAQGVLRRFYRPLIQRHPRHRVMLRLWLIVYAFVGVQMGWVLRPFIGDPGARTTFFRQDAWDNAYVVVARMIWEVVGR